VATPPALLTAIFTVPRLLEGRLHVPRLCNLYYFLAGPQTRARSCVTREPVSPPRYRAALSVNFLSVGWSGFSSKIQQYPFSSPLSTVHRPHPFIRIDVFFTDIRCAGAITALLSVFDEFLAIDPFCNNRGFLSQALVGPNPIFEFPARAHHHMPLL